MQNFKEKRKNEEKKNEDDGARFLGCKPLPGVSIVDLMGKPRIDETSTKLPFLGGGDHIFVQTLKEEKIHLILFDKDGYLVDDKNEDKRWLHGFKIIQ